jgi:hypothetical protein
MTRPLKTTLLALIAVAVSALAFTVAPAMASGSADKGACWKLVINDWYDGAITGKYELHCYRDALAHVNRDLKGYSSAYDDINRALQKRIAEIAAAKKAKTKPAVPPVASKPAKPNKPAKTNPTKPNKPSKTTTTPASNDNGGSNSTAAPPTNNNSSPPPPGAAPIKHRASDRHTGSTNRTKTHGTKPNPSASASTSTAKPKPANTAATSTPGRDTQGAGPVQSAIKSLGPSKATSVPIPLVVLAGLAGLLMLIGAASIVAKRAQTRRMSVAPARTSQQ